MNSKKIGVAFFLGLSVLSFAQEKDKEKEITEVVMVGTRAAQRTNVSSPLPVDAIDASIIQSSGQPTMDKALQYRIPSFNSTSSAVQDATSLLDPFEIRNLGASRTLVLVNGKRKNTSSLLYIQNTVGKGETGADLSAIPNIAIKKVEILRDGASAQYGSDAIAGVMNVVLKDNIKFSEINASLGLFSQGDGFSQNLSGITGITFNKGGFLMVAAQFQHNDYAQRSGVVSAAGEVDNLGADLADAQAYLAKYPDANNKNVLPKKIAGSLVVNLSVPVFEGGNLYANSSYISKKVNSYANHRTSYWKGEFVDSNQVFRNPLYNGGVGFSPTFEGNIEDFGGTIGLRVKTKNSWNLDFSGTYGSNDIIFTVNNSYNPDAIIDLGNYQTSFKPGGYNFKNIIGNIDISKALNDRIAIAFGTEARKEFFEIYAGDPMSYYKGGAISFPGMEQRNAGKYSRSNIGVYGDVAIDFTENTLLNLTGRYENYSDFGNALIGKASFRQKLNGEKLVFRASASTGFKAPSLHQLNISINQSTFINGQIQISGLIGNTSDAAKVLNLPSLKAEKSMNFTAGLGFQPNRNFSMTIDGYYIKIKDRIALSSTVPGLNPSDSSLSANFFINGLNTSTYGVDLVASYKGISLGNGSLGFNFAGNYNHSKIDSETSDIQNIRDQVKKNTATTANPNGLDIVPFNRMEEAILTTSRPKYKAVFGFDYSIGKFTLAMNNTLFGTAYWNNGGLPNSDNSATGLSDPDKPWNYPNEGNLSYIKFSPRVTSDFTVNYRINDKHSLNFNVMNAFNVMPKWEMYNLGSANKQDVYNLVTFSGRYQQSAYDSQHFSIFGTQFTLGYNVKF